VNTVPFVPRLRLLHRTILSKLNLLRPSKPNESRYRKIRKKFKSFRRPRWPRHRELPFFLEDRAMIHNGSIDHKDRIRSVITIDLEDEISSYQRRKLPSSVYLRVCRKIHTHFYRQINCLSQSTNRLLVQGYLFVKHISYKASERYAHGVNFLLKKLWKKHHFKPKIKMKPLPHFENEIRTWLAQCVPIPLGPSMALNYADLQRILRGSTRNVDSKRIRELSLPNLLRRHYCHRKSRP